MYILIEGPPGSCTDAIRAFLTKHHPNEIVDLTVLKEWGFGSPSANRDMFEVFMLAVMAHAKVAQIVFGRGDKHIIQSNSLWTIFETYLARNILPNGEKVFCRSLYRQLCDSIPQPDAVIYMHVDYPRAATRTGLLGAPINHADFDAQVAAMDQMMNRVAVPVEDVHIDDPEIDTVLELVDEIYKSFVDTFSGSDTIWEKKMFKTGE